MSFWTLWPFVSRKGRESKLIMFLRLLSTNVIWNMTDVIAVGLEHASKIAYAEDNGIVI